MGFRFRKSFKLAKGVRMTVSKSGISTRIGGKGFSVSSGKRGTRMNVGIPGTGVSYSTKLFGGSSSKRGSKSSAAPVREYHKDKFTTFILCLLLGFLGVHWFYLGQKGKGILYLCTIGLFGIGWIFDTIRLYIGLFIDKNKEYTDEEKSAKLKQMGIVTGCIAVFVIIAIIFSQVNSNDSKNNSAVSDIQTSENLKTIELENTETAETVAESANILTFELVAGEQGEYGKMITYNKDTEFEENFYAYYVPYGTYKITNIGEYMTQVNVYSDEVVITEAGWEEIADSVCNDVLDVGSSLTVTVPKNYHVEIGEPTHILMEQISAEVVEAKTTVTEETTTENTSIKTEKTVYITNTGKKYHSDSTCNGGDYFPATLSEAINQGLKPCEKCIG